MSFQPAGFKAEYARSGRSQCHLCKQPIPSANLRVASIHLFQGRENSHWHHPECFFKRGFTIPDVFAIQGIDKLQPNAQDFLKKSVQKLNGLQTSPKGPEGLKNSSSPSSSSSSSTPQRGQNHHHHQQQELEMEEQQDVRKFTLEDPEEDRIEPMRFRSKQKAASNAGSTSSSSSSSTSSAQVPEESPSRKPPSRTNSLFLEAVKSGNADEARNFLDLGADPDAEVTEGVTALTFAVFKGFVNLTKEILKYSPNVNTQTKLGETPLFLAAKAGSLNIAQLLLNHQAEKSIPNVQGITPQQIAADKGHNDVVEILLDIPSETERLRRDPSNQSSLPVFSLEMAGGNPSAAQSISSSASAQSFSSSASTQIDDPMQASTFIEAPPLSDSSPQTKSPAQDPRGGGKSTTPIEQQPDMDTFDQQQTHLLLSSSVNTPAAKKSQPENDNQPGPRNTRQNKRDLEQGPSDSSLAMQPIAKRPKATDSRAKNPPASPPANTLASFLREVGLEPEKFLKIFEEEEIDFGALMTLQEHHLKDLSLKMGPRNKILAGIAKYKNSSPSSSSSSSSSAPAPVKVESQGGANQSAEYEMAPIYIKVNKAKGKATQTHVDSQSVRGRHDGFTAVTTPKRTTRKQKRDHSSGGGETSETEVSEQEPSEVDAATIIIPKPPPVSATTFIIKPKTKEEEEEERKELKLDGNDPAELDGYQSTLEVSPEKRPPSSRMVDTASTVQDQTVTTPATTLASTLIQNNPASVQGSVSQLLSEIGHESFNASRQLQNHNGTKSSSKPEQATGQSSSPKKSPTKSFKAPEFNFKHATTGEVETQREVDLNSSQTQPYRSPPEKKVTYTVTKPKLSPPGRSAQSSANPNPIPAPNPTSHLSFIMSAIRTPIKDYLSSFSPRPNQTVTPKEIIKIELKPSVNLLRPQGFVSVVNEQHGAIKGNIDITKGSSLVTFSPFFPWKEGMTYTITVHADHTEVVGAGLLKDYSWTFFVM